MAEVGRTLSPIVSDPNELAIALARELYNYDPEQLLKLKITQIFLSTIEGGGPDTHEIVQVRDLEHTQVVEKCLGWEAYVVQEKELSKPWQEFQRRTVKSLINKTLVAIRSAGIKMADVLENFERPYFSPETVLKIINRSEYGNIIKEVNKILLIKMILLLEEREMTPRELFLMFLWLGPAENIATPCDLAIEFITKWMHEDQSLREDLLGFAPAAKLFENGQPTKKMAFSVVKLTETGDLACRSISGFLDEGRVVKFGQIFHYSNISTSLTLALGTRFGRSEGRVQKRETRFGGRGKAGAGQKTDPLKEVLKQINKSYFLAPVRPLNLLQTLSRLLNGSQGQLAPPVISLRASSGGAAAAAAADSEAGPVLRPVTTIITRVKILRVESRVDTIEKIHGLYQRTLICLINDTFYRFKLQRKVIGAISFIWKEIDKRNEYTLGPDDIKTELDFACSFDMKKEFQVNPPTHSVLEVFRRIDRCDSPHKLSGFNIEYMPFEISELEAGEVRRNCVDNPTKLLSFLEMLKEPTHKSTAKRVVDGLNPDRAAVLSRALEYFNLTHLSSWIVSEVSGIQLDRLENRFREIYEDIIEIAEYLEIYQNGSNIISLSQRKECIITEEREIFIKGEQIGKGGFTTVYTSFNLNSGRKFACKVINYLPSATHRIMQSVIRDQQLLIELRKKGARHIVEPYTALMKHVIRAPAGPHHMSIITFQKLYDRDAFNVQFFDSKILLRIGAAIGNALAALHEMGLVHVDLKLDNILLSGEGSQTEAFLSDMGTAVKIGETILSVTPRFMAPEYRSTKENEKFDEVCPATPEGDSYSLGLALYQLRYKLIFRDANEAARTLGQIIRDKSETPESVKMHQIWLKLMAANPKERMSCKQAAQEFTELLRKSGIDDEKESSTHNEGS